MQLYSIYAQCHLNGRLQICWDFCSLRVARLQHLLRYTSSSLATRLWSTSKLLKGASASVGMLLLPPILAEFLCSRWGKRFSEVLCTAEHTTHHSTFIRQKHPFHTFRRCSQRQRAHAIGSCRSTRAKHFHTKKLPSMVLPEHRYASDNCMHEHHCAIVK